jgi:hypothetical protein
MMAGRWCLHIPNTSIFRMPMAAARRARQASGGPRRNREGFRYEPARPGDQRFTFNFGRAAPCAGPALSRLHCAMAMVPRSTASAAPWRWSRAWPPPAAPWRRSCSHPPPLRPRAGPALTRLRCALAPVLLSPASAAPSRRSCSQPPPLRPGLVIRRRGRGETRPPPLHVMASRMCDPWVLLGGMPLQARWSITEWAWHPCAQRASGAACVSLVTRGPPHC